MKTEILKEGVRIYYNGDMANEEGFGVITKRYEDHIWGVSVDVKMDDGRTFPKLSVVIFSEEYLGHGGTRWVTEEAYKEYRKVQISNLKISVELQQELIAKIEEGSVR